MKILVPVARSCVSVCLFLALLSWTLTAIVAALAQTAMPETQLAKTVVTVSRVEQLAQEALPTAALITRAEIVGAQTPDLPILLRQETDLKINQKGGSGQWPVHLSVARNRTAPRLGSMRYSQLASGVFVGVIWQPKS